MLNLIITIGIVLLTGKIAFTIGYLKGLKDDLEWTEKMKDSYCYRHFVLGKSDKEILEKNK